MNYIEDTKSFDNFVSVTKELIRSIINLHLIMEISNLQKRLRKF